MASPFRHATPSIAAAMAYALAAGVWWVWGSGLPGGRWLTVHLFTLGVLTNLVLTFSEHFARTVTRTPGERSAWWPVATNVAIVTTLAGMVAAQRVAVAAGAGVLSGVVAAAYLRLRRMRRRSIGARFTWVARTYEQAHLAFLIGAVLGAALGVGALSGPWWSAVRLAHLHVNVLGWGGLTLLATLVFFGPSMARTRIEVGADARAARWLRSGALGLSVGVLGLVGSAASGASGTGARLVGAGGLAVFAAATAVVCLPVVRATRTAPATAARPAVLAICAWFCAVVIADVLVVATGAWGRLDALGLAVLLGVLAQAMVTTIVYLAPMLRGTSPAGRERVRSRLERFATGRVAVLNLGAAAAVAASVGPRVPILGGLAAGAVLVALVWTALVVCWPLPAEPPRASRADADVGLPVGR